MEDIAYRDKLNKGANKVLYKRVKCKKKKPMKIKSKISMPVRLSAEMDKVSRIAEMNALGFAKT
jgi:hypothetical protein